MSNYKRQKLEAGYDYNKTATQDSCVASHIMMVIFPVLAKWNMGNVHSFTTLIFQGVER